MFHRGKCPSCGKIPSHANIDNLKLTGGGMEYVGVAYLCPLCNAILSVSMDQVALNADVVQRVLKALGRG